MLLFCHLCLCFSRFALISNWLGHGSSAMGLLFWAEYWHFLSNLELLYAHIVAYYTVLFRAQKTQHVIIKMRWHPLVYLLRKSRVKWLHQYKPKICGPCVRALWWAQLQDCHLLWRTENKAGLTQLLCWHQWNAVRLEMPGPSKNSMISQWYLKIRNGGRTLKNKCLV